MILREKKHRRKEPMKGGMVKTRDKDSLVWEHVEFEVEKSSGLTHVAMKEDPWVGRAPITTRLQPSLSANCPTRLAQYQRGKWS